MTDTTNREQLLLLYQNRLPDDLRLLLSNLNNLIGRDPDGAIMDAYVEWLGSEGVGVEPQLLRQYHLDRESVRVPATEIWSTELPNRTQITVEQFLALALLGMQRIYHVHQNTLLSPSEAKMGYAILQSTKALVEDLQVDQLPQLTIHGNEIAWKAEIAQDTAKTYQRIGETDEAVIVLDAVLSEFVVKEQVLGQLLSPGERSAQAVILHRIGDLTRHLLKKIQGTHLERENAFGQFNRERLITLAFGTLKSAVDPEFDATLFTRLRALNEAMRALLRSFQKEPINTLKYSTAQIRKLL